MLALTAPRASSQDRIGDYHAVAALGRTQEVTKEGFLICHDVCLARVGEMVYGPNETPIQVGPDGIARIVRTPDEVFKDAALKSLKGKSVVDEHPLQDVDPANWRSLSCGIVLDVRRGVGDDSDFIVGDLLITTPEAIQAVKDGKREVSCGYDASYYQTGPGLGEQRDIIYNHVALVERGRCGPRCAIGDKEPDMKNPLATALGALKTAIGTKDDALISSTLANAEQLASRVAGDSPSGVTINLNGARTRDEEGEKKDDDKKTGDEDPDKKAMKDDIEGLKKAFGDMKTTMDSVAEAVKKIGDRSSKDEDKEDKDKKTDDEKILGELALEAPPGTGDEAVAKAKDSAFMGDSFQAVVAGAEIIAPGLRVPAFDSALSPKKTLDVICKHRRAALDIAFVNPAFRPVIDDLLQGRTFDMRSATCSAVRSLFNSVVAVGKQINNTRDAGGADRGTTRARPGFGQVRSLADMNKANRDFYAPKAPVKA